MAFSGIFKKFFRRKSKIIVLRREKLIKNRKNVSAEEKTDTAIFEIVHTFSLDGQGTIISGKIKRGFFRTGDRVIICNPSETNAKTKAKILNIKTELLEVTRINSGTKADFLIEMIENDSVIMPGDRVYKLGGNRNVV